MSVSDPAIDEETAVKRIIEQTAAEVSILIHMETNTQNVSQKKKNFLISSVIRNNRARFRYIFKNYIYSLRS